MELQPGASLGAYAILEYLGEGGLATVYKGRHTVLDRDVALKVLKPALRSQPGFRELFRREARLVAGLDHPNILSVHDFAEQGEWLFMVIKFVDGTTLRRRIDRGPLPQVECARLLGAVGAALHHAHSQNVVHGDLKPGNIWLAEDGNVFLSDFGAGRLATGYLGLTEPHYASPEQAVDATQFDARSDQYSLGVVMFEALTGRLPFGAREREDVLQQHLLALPPAPSVLNRQLTPSVDEVILKALAKNPDQRYPDVSALVAAFQRSTAPPRPSTAPVRRSPATDVLPPPVPRPAPGGPPAIMVVVPGGPVVRLEGKREYWLGRSDPNRPFSPDVDLAEYGGLDQGVSRQHGRLHIDNNRLYYTDEKSSNGSRVNGASLRSEIAMELEDGDEICLGKFVCRVYFGP